MSLRNKLFISFAVITLLLLAFIFVAVEIRVREQVSTDTLTELAQTDAAFVEQWQFLRERLAREGAIVADAPKMKAALDTGDQATIEPVAQDYRQMIGADLLELRDPTGGPVARLSEGEEAPYLELSFPIVVGESVLGSLTTGYSLNQGFAARMKRLVGAEVAVVSGGGVVASTLSKDREAELAATLPRLGPGPDASDQNPSWEVRLGGESFLARSVSEEPAPGVEFLILRSVDESLRFLGAVRRDLLLFAIFTMVLALLASYLTARTLTRPLAAIVEGMRETARSGDLTRQIHIESRDEEASLLASTFNHVASSLLAFQQQARHKERLSSLGTLSATLAHEIRNPLTIIKGSALQLLEEKSLGQDEREAAADIIQEVDRLNRLVQSVLDSARPDAFQVEEVDINDLCQDCLAAVADSPGVRAESSFDPRLESAPVDPARLKQVLLNLLLNAREALSGPGTIRVATRRESTDYAISVSDTGKGIPDEDLPNIFDPFFTQKPNGTGLGLSVARNIVEGLGGTISVRSRLGRGTEIELRLPMEPRLADGRTAKGAET
jgi:signal transduction histidine kinase